MSFHHVLLMMVFVSRTKIWAQNITVSFLLDMRITQSSLPGHVSTIRGHWVYLAALSVSASLCVQIKAVSLQQRQTSSQLNKDSNVSVGFYFTAASGGESTSPNKQQTLSVRLHPAETLKTADGCMQPLVTMLEVTETLRGL